DLDLACLEKLLEVSLGVIPIGKPLDPCVCVASFDAHFPKAGAIIRLVLLAEIRVIEPQGLRLLRGIVLALWCIANRGLGSGGRFAAPSLRVWVFFVWCSRRRYGRHGRYGRIAGEGIGEPCPLIPALGLPPNPNNARSDPKWSQHVGERML